jgi:hypothetical protein
MTLRNAPDLLARAPSRRPDREPPCTTRHTTGRRARHAWIVALAAALAVGCGGSKRTDTYQKATLAQERCCEHLEGAARSECLSGIPRVDDPSVATTSANQATFRCVEDHFVCDPTTGHATQPSAQEQYDCIAALDD